MRPIGTWKAKKKLRSFLFLHAKFCCLYDLEKGGDSALKHDRERTLVKK